MLKFYIQFQPIQFFNDFLILGIILGFRDCAPCSKIVRRFIYTCNYMLVVMHQNDTKFYECLISVECIKNYT